MYKQLVGHKRATRISRNIWQKPSGVYNDIFENHLNKDYGSKVYVYKVLNDLLLKFPKEFRVTVFRFNLSILFYKLSYD